MPVILAIVIITSTDEWEKEDVIISTKTTLKPAEDSVKVSS